MTMQAVLDGRELGQVATNAGWWDFAAWAAALPARFAEVRRLADRGMTPRAGALHAQLVDAIAAHPTPAGVDDVVGGLLSLLPEDGPGVFLVGDGVGDDVPIDEEIPVVHSNPKGCNQYSGPGCATYPTLKRTPGGAHELPSRDSPGVKRVTPQELTTFHGAVPTDIPGSIHEVAGKLGWDPHQTGHVLRRAMAEGLVSGRVAELLTGHPREQEYTYKNAEGELIGRVVKKTTHNVSTTTTTTDALGYEIEEGGGD